MDLGQPRNLAGRTKLPNVDDYLPRFNGYSVGIGKATRLLSTTNGFDDRQWLDQYGFPVSEKATFWKNAGIVPVRIAFA